MKDNSGDLKAGFILINPFSEIDNARQRKSYFEAFALAGTYFEYYGYLKLKGIISREKLDRMTAGPIREALIKRKLIDPKINKKMKEVITLRNDLVHPEGDIARKYRLKSDEIALLDVAKECIKELMFI